MVGVTDDKAFEAARARVRLLEQTVAELRNQLASRATPGRAAVAERAAGDSRPRRVSMRPPAARSEPDPAVFELNAALDAVRRELEARTRERDEARMASSRRESEVEALHAERDRALAASSKWANEIEALRTDRDETRSNHRALEQERDKLRARVASLEAQIEVDRAKPTKASVRPAKRNSAEIEAQNTRVQALERQLDALRVAWKASEERAQALESKLKQVRSVETVAILRAAADRAGELARLLEGAASKLKADDPSARP